MSRLGIITKYFIRNALNEMFAGRKMKPIFIVILMIFTVSMISMPFTVIIGSGYGVLHSMG